MYGQHFYRCRHAFLSYYGTSSLLDERDIHLIGQFCPICPLNVNVGSETGMRPCVIHSPKVLLLKYGPPFKVLDFQENTSKEHLKFCA